MPKKTPGLYANINAKRERIAEGSGEKMRKPGAAGAPTAKAFKASAKTAKKAYGGSVDDDYDDSDAPPRTKYRPAPDAQSYESDIDYRDSLSGGSGKPQKSFVKPPKATKGEELRAAKMARKTKADTAMVSGRDREAAEKAFVRRHVRERSEGLRKVAKISPNSAPKMRKQWSEEIGGGKPAPFKEGGKAKSCW